MISKHICVSAYWCCLDGAFNHKHFSHSVNIGLTDERMLVDTMPIVPAKVAWPLYDGYTVSTSVWLSAEPKSIAFIAIRKEISCPVEFTIYPKHRWIFKITNHIIPSKSFQVGKENNHTAKYTLGIPLYIHVEKYINFTPFTPILSPFGWRTIQFKLSGLLKFINFFLTWIITC